MQKLIAKKECRNMKVYGQSGYNYKTTPTIMLKGQWLKEMGFTVVPFGQGYSSMSSPTREFFGYNMSITFDNVTFSYEVSLLKMSLL